MGNPRGIHVTLPPGRGILHYRYPDCLRSPPPSHAGSPFKSNELMTKSFLDDKSPQSRHLKEVGEGVVWSNGTLRVGRYLPFHKVIQLPRLKQNKSDISDLLSSIDPTFSFVWFLLHVSLSRIVGFILTTMASTEGGGKRSKYRRTLNRRTASFDSLTIKIVRHVVSGEWTLVAQMDEGLG